MSDAVPAEPDVATTDEAWAAVDPKKARRLVRLREVVRDALENDMAATAAWYADKLVTLSQGKPEDVLLLARSYFASGDYARAARVLRAHKTFDAPLQPTVQHNPASWMLASSRSVEQVSSRAHERDGAGRASGAAAGGAEPSVVRQPRRLRASSAIAAR